MKETYYFPHDYNARNDEKLIKLQKEVGLEAIAIYWMLIEMLYEANGYLDYNCENLAFALRIEYERITTIKKVIYDYNLFVIKDEKFTSKRVIENLQFRQEKSEKARNSIRKRWNNTNVLPTKYKGNTIKERKGKERKDILSAVADEVFNYQEYLAQMKLNKNRHIQIIAHYFEMKGLDFPTLKAIQAEIGKWVKVASTLKDYPDEQLNWAFDNAIKNWSDSWSLQAVISHISEFNN